MALSRGYVDSGGLYQGPSEVEWKTEVAVNIPAEARRYAEVLSASAGSLERIQRLEELLAQSEWHRRLAEEQVGTIKESYGVELGKVFHATDENPAVTDGVQRLFDLATGDVWEIDAGDKERTMWSRLDPWKYGQHTRQPWPFESVGPLMALEDPSGLLDVYAKANKLHDEVGSVRLQIVNLPGYREDGKPSYPEPALSSALDRVIRLLRKQVSDAQDEARAHKENASKALLQAAEAEAANVGDWGPEIRRLSLSIKEAIAPTDQKSLPARSVHSIVHMAESRLLKGSSVPEDGGDPSYSADSLLEAAELLILAARCTKIEGGETFDAVKPREIPF